MLVGPIPCDVTGKQVRVALERANGYSWQPQNLLERRIHLLVQNSALELGLGMGRAVYSNCADGENILSRGGVEVCGKWVRVGASWADLGLSDCESW